MIGLLAKRVMIERKTARCWILAALVVLTLSTKSHAITVSEGCVAPNVADTGRTYFVDPSKGRMENDGSEERPWRTLSEVLDPRNRLVKSKSYSRWITAVDRVNIACSKIFHIKHEIVSIIRIR